MGKITKKKLNIDFATAQAVINIFQTPKAEQG
jgi:hypothetical protein